MATRRIQIHDGEAALIAGLLSERDSVTKSLRVAVNMVCAREGITVGMLSGLRGNTLLLEVPDDLGKLDRVDSATRPEGVAGDTSAAPKAQTPAELNPAGKAYPFDHAGEAPEIREHATGG